MGRRRHKAQKISTNTIRIDQRELMVSTSNPLLLLIGKWKFEPIHAKDELILKLFFARKQLSFEVLWEGCIEKIVIEWSNIVGMRASDGKEPGILHLELSEPPKFYKKLILSNADQRAHHKWVPGLDFTQGQASTHRRHSVMFPPGMLINEYQRLIRSDAHLFEISQKPFPTFDDPNFFNIPKQPFLQTSPQNQFGMTGNQLISHAALTPSTPQGVASSSNLISFAPSFGSVTMNPSFQGCSNWRVPQEECSSWRIPQVEHSSLGVPQVEHSSLRVPQVEHSSWRVPQVEHSSWGVPQIANTYSNANANSNGYLWNNNIGGMFSNNGCSSSSNSSSRRFSSMPIMYGDGISHATFLRNNPHEPLDSQEDSDGYFSNNWPTDEYGVWLPPPQI